MRGVYLVAAELSRLGFIASPTSRSARGADILVADQSCQRTYSVQVKTNGKAANFWLLSKHARKQFAKRHIYVLVNIRQKGGSETAEYYVVPSKVLARKMYCVRRRASKWYAIRLKEVSSYRDRWSIFGKPTD